MNILRLEYIKQQVDVRITLRMIEVFFNQLRISSHPRLYGKEGQYSTIQDHMPEKHKQYVQWDSHRFYSWAESIGPSTNVVIRSILTSHKVEQQGYRACMGILKLADKYSILRLEVACTKALSYTPNPGYKNISTILKSGNDKFNCADSAAPAVEIKDGINDLHSFTRGADYYGRKQ